MDRTLFLIQPTFFTQSSCVQAKQGLNLSALSPLCVGSSACLCVTERAEGLPSSPRAPPRCQCRVSQPLSASQTSRPQLMLANGSLPCGLLVTMHTVITQSSASEPPMHSCLPCHYTKYTAQMDLHTKVCACY